MRPRGHSCIHNNMPTEVTAMNRIFATVAMMIAITTAAAFGQVREANGLKVNDNGTTVTFQTVVQGDSIYKVHERFELPGDMKVNWSREILPTWRRANPEITTKNDWIFQRGITYTVPTEYVEAFRQAIPTVAPEAARENPVDPKSTLDSKAGQAVTQKEAAQAGQTSTGQQTQSTQNAQSGPGVLGWLVILALAGAAVIIGMLVSKLRRSQQETRDANNAQRELAENAQERIDSLHNSVREANRPISEIGPPVVEGGINPTSPDAPAAIDRQFTQVADNLRNEIARRGPVTMPALTYDAEERVLAAADDDEQITITAVGNKVGPAYRGFVDGELSVLGGDGRWRNARGHGDPAYWAMFRVTTEDGERETPLIYLEVCCNDIRLRQDRYNSFNARVVNCTVVEGTSVRPAAQTTAPATEAGEQPKVVDAEVVGGPNELKRRAYLLATTPFEHTGTKQEAYFTFVFGTPENPLTEGRAERFGLLARYHLLPNRQVETVMTKPSMKPIDFRVAQMRLHHLYESGQINQGIKRGIAATEAAVKFVDMVNKVAEHGRDVQFVMFGNTFVNLSTPLVDVDVQKRRAISDGAVAAAIERNPDLFAEGQAVAMTKSISQLNAWVANTLPTLPQEDRQALLTFTTEKHNPITALLEAASDSVVAKEEAKLEQARARAEEVGFRVGNKLKALGFADHGRMQMEKGNATAASYCAQAALALDPLCGGASQLLDEAMAAITAAATPSGDAAGTPAADEGETAAV